MLKNIKSSSSKRDDAKEKIPTTKKVKYKNNQFTFVNVAGGKIKLNEKIVVAPRSGYFDDSAMYILDVFLIDEGMLLFYHVKKVRCIGVALFDKLNPEVLLWRTANPIFTAEVGFIPQKILISERNVIIHFYKNKKTQKIKVYLDFLLHKLKGQASVESRPIAPVIQRSQENPIIKPYLTHHWESCATFNTAALFLAGKVHFIYRAIGAAGMSVLGYAASKDGIHIDERLSEPVYLPREPFEFRQDKSNQVLFDYESGGGGWGGCEDPRLTHINDVIYMTYTAFNGSEPPGVALTAIKTKDFLNKKWNWHKPVLISPRGQINKNWVIFPEKINGKYAILHNISPGIQISYFDNLNFDKSISIHSHPGTVQRNGCWDNQPRGVGPSPIKTKDGWLIFYHAMDKRDPNKYKLGAMMLDYQNPTKILYRAIEPVLEPDAYYENYGYKGGVIYSCGAVIIEDQLFVYYGGGDTVTCVATANLPEFLEKLKSCRMLQAKIAENLVEVIK